MRYREIKEAAYDDQVKSLYKKYSDKTDFIDDQVNFAKQVLKKSKIIVWYLRIVSAFLSGNKNKLEKLLGGYQNDLDKIKEVLGHYTSINYEPIQDYAYGNKTVEQVFSELSELEEKYKEKKANNRPAVSPEEGDYIIKRFKDGTSWWWVDRGYCEQEGASGLHCGNIMGREMTQHRILSLRDSDNRVILTFVLDTDDSTLGEMKAVANQKPDKKYHKHIVSLLVNKDLEIQGFNIASTYMPENNFKLSDLSYEYIAFIEEHNPKIIESALSLEPTLILKFKDKKVIERYFNDSPEYVQKLLMHNDDETWNEVISDFEDEMKQIENSLEDDDWGDDWSYNNQKLDNMRTELGELFALAPMTIESWKERIVAHLCKRPYDFLKLRKDIRNDYKTVKYILLNSQWPDIYKTIPESTPNYMELMYDVFETKPVLITLISPRTETVNGDDSKENYIKFASKLLGKSDKIDKAIINNLTLEQKLQLGIGAEEYDINRRSWSQSSKDPADYGIDLKGKSDREKIKYLSKMIVDLYKLNDVTRLGGGYTKARINICIYELLHINSLEVYDEVVNLIKELLKLNNEWAIESFIGSLSYHTRISQFSLEIAKRVSKEADIIDGLIQMDSISSQSDFYKELFILIDADNKLEFIKKDRNDGSFSSPFFEMLINRNMPEKDYIIYMYTQYMAEISSRDKKYSPHRGSLALIMDNIELMSVRYKNRTVENIFRIYEKLDNVRYTISRRFAMETKIRKYYVYLVYKYPDNDSLSFASYITIDNDNVKYVASIIKRWKNGEFNDLGAKAVYSLERLEQKLKRFQNDEDNRNF